MKKHCYDPECEKLAEYFLPSGSRSELVGELSQVLQDTIEDWLSLKADELAQRLAEPSK